MKSVDGRGWQDGGVVSYRTSGQARSHSRPVTGVAGTAMTHTSMLLSCWAGGEAL